MFKKIKVILKEPLVGTCFCFEVVLPICEECSAASEPTIPASNKPIFNAHVLVVDDNPANRKVAEAMLKSAGCTVTSANNGKEGLDILIAGGIDLVLMDCQMPMMDGYEATEAWREQERDKRIPIIALTANASTDNETACCGMSAMPCGKLPELLVGPPDRRHLRDLVIQSTNTILYLQLTLSREKIAQVLRVFSL